MVDYYAVTLISNQLTATLSALFSPEFIGDANLRDLHDGDVDPINDALEAELLRIGYEENPRPGRGIDGEDKLIIGDDGFDRSREPIRTLMPIFEEFMQAYLAALRDTGFPSSMLDSAYRYRLFATATKGNGYHPPHIHSRAAFAMV